MDRLTSNKDVKDMGMVELAYNSCYARNGKARYRDYDSDIDARQLAIQLLERYADIPNEFTCDDDFDERMIGYMSYGIENPEGLIALVYRNLWAMADLRERLKRYEDTNLTPEKILELDKMYQELSKEVMKYRKVATVDDFKMYISMFNPEVIEEHMKTLIRIIHNHGTLRELLDECEEYKAIGTVEECREAMEKQRAERPQLIGDGVDKDGNMIYDMYDCPDCGTRYEIDYEKYNFCPNCGKAIDWRDRNDEE